MYHYVYRVEHIETSQFYIGSRSSKLHPSVDNYLGSMCTWKPDKTKLIKIIIKDDFKTRDEALKFEAELIKEFIENDLNENYHIPSDGFHTHNMKRSDEWKSWNCERLIGENNPMYGKRSSGFTGKTHSKETREKLRVSSLGKTHKEETKKKIGESNSISQLGNSNSQYGTCWITNGIENKKIKKTDDIPSGWSYGRKINSRSN